MAAACRESGRLKGALTQGDQPEALEAARALIDRVIVSPPETDGDQPGVELIGELTALLKAAGIASPSTSEGALWMLPFSSCSSVW